MPFLRTKLFTLLLLNAKGPHETQPGEQRAAQLIPAKPDAASTALFLSDYPVADSSPVLAHRFPVTFLRSQSRAPLRSPAASSALSPSFVSLSQLSQTLSQHHGTRAVRSFLHEAKDPHTTLAGPWQTRSGHCPLSSDISSPHFTDEETEAQRG